MRLRERERELRGEVAGVVAALTRVVVVEWLVDEAVLEEFVDLCEEEELEEVGGGEWWVVEEGMVRARRTRRNTFVDWDMLVYDEDCYRCSKGSSCCALNWELRCIV